MKKIISLSLFLFPLVTCAQFNKDQVFLSGGFSVGTNSQNYTTSPTQTTIQTKNSSYSFAPTFGYFINPKMAVGAGVGYTYRFSDSKNITGFQNTKSNGIIANLFSRYYFPITQSFNFVVKGEINFNRSKDEYNVNDGTQTTTYESDYYSIGFGISPTFVFFPSPKWSIESSFGSLGYGYSRDIPKAYSNNSFGFGIYSGGLNFSLIYYPKRKDSYRSRR